MTIGTSIGKDLKIASIMLGDFKKNRAGSRHVILALPV